MPDLYLLPPERPLPPPSDPDPNFRLADAFREPADREKPFGRRLEELIHEADEEE
jgi:hypothetical protein